MTTPTTSRKDALLDLLNLHFSDSTEDFGKVADLMLAELDATDPLRNPTPEFFQEMSEVIEESADAWLMGPNQGTDVNDVVAKQVFVLLASK